MKLSKEDFKANITAEGYMITYKGKPIGGASILGKSKARGKARMENMKGYSEQAAIHIDNLVAGNYGDNNHMMQSVRSINVKFWRDKLSSNERSIFDSIMQSFPATDPESAYDHAINEGTDFNFISK